MRPEVPTELLNVSIHSGTIGCEYQHGGAAWGPPCYGERGWMRGCMSVWECMLDTCSGNSHVGTRKTLFSNCASLRESETSLAAKSSFSGSHSNISMNILTHGLCSYYTTSSPLLSTSCPLPSENRGFPSFAWQPESQGEGEARVYVSLTEFTHLYIVLHTVKTHRLLGCQQ